jgi:hypothetical protein
MACNGTALALEGNGISSVYQGCVLKGLETSHGEVQDKAEIRTGVLQITRQMEERNTEHSIFYTTHIIKLN